MTSLHPVLEVFHKVQTLGALANAKRPNVEDLDSLPHRGASMTLNNLELEIVALVVVHDYC